MPPRKRPASKAGGTAASKRSRSTASIVPGGSQPGSPIVPAVVTSNPDASATNLEELRQRFIQVCSAPEHEGGVSNRALKTKFGSEYVQLVPIINELTQQSRLVMSKIGDELFYNLVSDAVASKFTGLDTSARMVYQVIERAGSMGIWTKDVRMQTNLPQTGLNKIFKALETRRLIKPVKSVNAKAKKLYMLYNLTPAKALTGGPWYTELEFDHEFISELRTFLMHCVRRLNGGKGVTLSEIKEKMVQANVSRVQLNLEEVQQLVQTLAFDHLIEQAGTNERGEALFCALRKVTPMCEFKWWDVLSPDFHFRTIQFEDGVTLSAHEPHHHTA